jgi:hypothetical protein
MARNRVYLLAFSPAPATPPSNSQPVDSAAHIYIPIVPKAHDLLLRPTFKLGINISEQRLSLGCHGRGRITAGSE